MTGEPQDAKFEPATVFDVTIQFGPHQARLLVNTEVVSGSDDEALTHYLAEHLAPHLKEMFAAEKRNENTRGIPVADFSKLNEGVPSHG